MYDELQFQQVNFSFVKKPVGFGNKTYRVLSYTCFGENSLQKYSENIKSVAREASASFFYGGDDGWQFRIYTDVEVPAIFNEEVRSINQRLLFVNIFGNEAVLKTNGMTWRFIPMADPWVDIACFRDLDSVIFKREEAAVREFLASEYKKVCHVMRDHPHHTAKIMGGMWCFRNEIDRPLAKSLLIKILSKTQKRVPGIQEAKKGNDQDVLDSYIWPIVIKQTMVHDAYHCKWTPGGRPFPTQREIKGPDAEPYVGCGERPCIINDVNEIICCYALKNVGQKCIKIGSTVNLCFFVISRIIDMYDWVSNLIPKLKL